MLSVHNNNLANQVYVPFLQNLNNLEDSAKRLSTGVKFSESKDGAGEMGLADIMKQKIGGIDRLLSGMENAAGFTGSQDDVLNDMAEILVRAAEIAAGALDPNKTTADRTALTAEYAQLSAELVDLSTRTYNGSSLFTTGTTLTIRMGLEGTETIAISAVDLTGFSLGGGSISTVGHASAALVSIDTRTGSLNIMRARVGAYQNRIQRSLDFTRSIVSNLENVEDSIRNVDVAREAGEFTKDQVLLAASQSVLAQTNGIVQGALQFLG